MNRISHCTTLLLCILSAPVALCSAADVEMTLLAHPASAAVKPGATTEVWRYTGTQVSGPAGAVTSFPTGYLGPIVRVDTGDRLIVHFTNDLAVFFSAWGSPDADLNGDGTTDSNDLSYLLSN